MRKIELVKQTTKFTGDIYYYVAVDGAMQSGTFTSDLAEAEKHFERIKELVKLYPVTVTETIKEEEL